MKCALPVSCTEYQGSNATKGGNLAEAGVEQRGGQEGHLQPGLKRRHMTMIAIGGIIGAGLFVGTGPILNQAGPATILTYLLTGTILILIMRMLGEMAVAQPSVGSFSDYSRMALGNWAGFSVGWLYWYFWAIVVGFEATVAASILTEYIPGIAPWLMSLILVLLLTATNLYSVGSYGEFEFWFAGIKVAAIISFIVLAALFIIGLLPGGGVGLSNLYAEGGFFPNGGLVMFSGVATVIFAFVGAEIVTIAAAESNEPERGIARATNQVIYRILLFYVVSVFFVAAVVPWNTPFSSEEVLKSPFTLAFDRMGIPFAPQRSAAVFPHPPPPRRPDVGYPRRDHLRLRQRPALLLLPGAGLHVADQRLWRHRALRLPADRHLGARDASSPGARGAREAPVEDVALPVADVPVDSRHGCGAGRDGRHPRTAPPADSERDQRRRDPRGLSAPPPVRTPGEVPRRGGREVEEGAARVV